MKIKPLSTLFGIKEASLNSTNSTVKSIAEQRAGAVKIADVRSGQQAVIATISSGTDAAKVERLKQEVADGSYKQPTSDKLAQKIVDYFSN